MNCAEFATQLDDYLDDMLDAGTLAAYQAHLAECDSCAALSGRARVIHRALADYGVPPPGRGFVDQSIERASRGRKSISAGRMVAAAFVATLLLSVVTVILTGLNVGAPRTELAAGLPSVSMRVAEPRVINLVFDARQPLDEVTVLMTLPRGVELDGYPGQTQIEWKTSLAAGKNVLPLALVVRDGMGGQLVAQLGHGELRKVFRVHLDVSAG